MFEGCGKEALTLTPSWPLVGIVLIFIGFFVRFDVQVVDADEKEGIKKQKEVKSRNMNG